MLFKSELNELLVKGQNVVYVWSGSGYLLDEVTTKKDQLSIEELAYICIKSGKGCFRTISQIEKDEFDVEMDYFENECYCYCDMSSYGLENGFLLTENLHSFDVEIYS